MSLDNCIIGQLVQWTTVANPILLDNAVDPSSIPFKKGNLTKNINFRPLLITIETKDNRTKIR